MRLDATERQVTLDMANLRPSVTGIGAYVHVYQNLDQRARHCPRIKVYPGSPGAGDATTIAIPHHADPYVLGSITVSQAVLRRALEFAELNREALTQYWVDPDMGTDELIDELMAVDE
jgi:hypothetical protein